MKIIICLILRRVNVTVEAVYLSNGRVHVKYIPMNTQSEDCLYEI